MKKFLKFTLLTAMITILTMSLVACGNKEEKLKYPDQSKTYNAMIKLYEEESYKMVMSGKMDEETNAEVIMAKKSEKVYMSMKSGDDSIVIIVKDGKYYMVSDTDKQYIETEASEDENPLDNIALVTEDDLKSMKDAEYKTGKEEVNGTKYDYEEYTENEESVRYYFEGNTLKYVKDMSTEEIVEIKEITNDVQDSLFEIPSDYEKVEM